MELYDYIMFFLLIILILKIVFLANALFISTLYLKGREFSAEFDVELYDLQHKFRRDWFPVPAFEKDRKDPGPYSAGIDQYEQDYMIYYKLPFWKSMYSNMVKKKVLKGRNAPTLEFVGTAIPSIILIMMGLPSFTLLYSLEATGHPVFNILVIGNQGYGTYEYIDFDVQSFFSFMVSDFCTSEVQQLNYLFKKTLKMSLGAIDDAGMLADKYENIVMVKFQGASFFNMEVLRKQADNFDSADLYFIFDNMYEFLSKFYNNDSDREIISDLFDDQPFEYYYLIENFGDNKNTSFEKGIVDGILFLEKISFYHSAKSTEFLVLNLLENLTNFWPEVQSNPLLKTLLNFDNSLITLVEKENYDIEIKPQPSLLESLDSVDWDGIFHPVLEPVNVPIDIPAEDFMIHEVVPIELIDHYLQVDNKLVFFETCIDTENYMRSARPIMKYFNPRFYYEFNENLTAVINSIDPCISIDSQILADSDLPLGYPRLLSADQVLVLPSETTVRLLVTSNDVIHSFAVPSFGVKIDAVPGRINQVIIKTPFYGTSGGQCSELCGVNHGFMPIEIRVMPLCEFNYYIKLLMRSSIEDKFDSLMFKRLIRIFL